MASKTSGAPAIDPVAAPSDAAWARRSAWRSATTGTHPRRTSSRASISPIVPPPRMAARDGRGPARSTACTAAASGSAIAAPAAGRPSGIGCSAASGAAICSAKPPTTQAGERQICDRAARHGAHAAHATESDTNTRSPVSVRTPAVSWPNPHG